MFSEAKHHTLVQPFSPLDPDFSSSIGPWHDVLLFFTFSTQMPFPNTNLDQTRRNTTVLELFHIPFRSVERV